MLVEDAARHGTGNAPCRTAFTTAFPPQGVITMSKRDDYVEAMKTQLDELNTKMDTLEAKAQEAKESAREKYREEMSKLRRQSQLTIAKLDEIKVAGEDTWQPLVAEMEKTRDAFKHSFHYFKSQL
jgi:hypothetical protein